MRAALALAVVLATAPAAFAVVRRLLDAAGAAPGRFGGVASAQVEPIPDEPGAAWLQQSFGNLPGQGLRPALRALVPWDRQRDLDRLAPPHIEVPSGSHVPVDYGNPAEPTLSVRLQEMFGLTETPRIAGGKVPLTIHLLSPARRPVQVTRSARNVPSWTAPSFSTAARLRALRASTRSSMRR